MTGDAADDIVTADITARRRTAVLPAFLRFRIARPPRLQHAVRRWDGWVPPRDWQLPCTARASQQRISFRSATALARQSD